ncbi:MAG: hypothetical protein AB1668_00965 [Nanoarchaeota archaeon]
MKRNRYLLFSVLLIALIATGAILVNAAEQNEQNTALIINETIFLGGTVSPELQPLIETIQPLIMKISVLVGGIFGLYLILSLLRVYYEAKKVKLLQAIRYDLDQLNEHYNLPHSKTRAGFFRRIANFFNPNSKNSRK